METTIIGHSERTLKDCMPLSSGRFCCCGSAPRSGTDVTGDPGRGDWKFDCEPPGVEGPGGCAFAAGVALSSCSRTTFSICSKSSWINVRNCCTLPCRTLCWCRIISDVILTHNVALSSLSVRTRCISRSTISSAYGSKGSGGAEAVGNRLRTSRTQFRSFCIAC